MLVGLIQALALHLKQGTAVVVNQTPEFIKKIALGLRKRKV